MKNFFETYWTEVVAPSFGWLTRHWKGYIVFSGAIAAFGMAVAFRDIIIEWFKNKFNAIKRFKKEEP